MSGLLIQFCQSVKIDLVGVTSVINLLHCFFFVILFGSSLSIMSWCKAPCATVLDRKLSYSYISHLFQGILLCGGIWELQNWRYNVQSWMEYHRRRIKRISMCVHRANVIQPRFNFQKRPPRPPGMSKFIAHHFEMLLVPALLSLPKFHYSLQHRVYTNIFRFSPGFKHNPLTKGPVLGPIKRSSSENMNKCFACTAQRLLTSVNVALFPTNSFHLKAAFWTKLSSNLSWIP